MGDSDSGTMMILLLVVVVLVLKPDLLDGILGSRPTTGGGVPYGLGGGPFVTLQPPPAADPSPPVWKAVDLLTPALDAFNKAHPCPAGQLFNTATQRCEVPIHVGDTNVPGWSVTTPSPCGFTRDANGWSVPAPCPEAATPQATPAAPAAVGDVKAAAKRAAMFTPFG